jgi:3-oxoacyl-[acyl-carrier protein] reductase
MSASPTRVALVTGASRGLGAQIARVLGGAGMAVAVNGRTRSPEAVRVVQDIRAAGGVAEVFPTDVTDEAAVGALVTEVDSRLGPVDVLVINATGPQPKIGVAELTWPDLVDQLVFFVKSPTLLVQAVLPGMKERRHGRIINIGSDVVERIVPGMSAYAGAKAAQLALTRTWARELGPYGITVNLVAPGWIPVERHAGASADSLAAYRDDVALGRLGSPADVAAVVAFLASPAAGFITGERIAVNGGHTIA